MVPVTVVTGFLGAGKTTLLNGLLRRPNGLRLAVLVNDFGAVNIDAELLRAASEDIVALENGCICCSLSAGLQATVAKVVRRADPPDQILIETSGVSDPWQVVEALADPELQPYAPLDGVVTVVDAESWPVPEGEPRRVAQRQVAAADLIVLNKADLVDTASLEETASGLRAQAPGARVRPARNGDVRLAELLALRRGARYVASDGAQPDPHAFDTVTLTEDRPLALRDLHATLASLPPTVLRVKGVIAVAEKPGHRCILQATGTRATLTVADPNAPAALGPSRIVVIGTAGGLDADWFRRKLWPPRATTLA